MRMAAPSDPSKIQATVKDAQARVVPKSSAILASYLKQKVFRWAGDTTSLAWEWSTIQNARSYVALSHTWGSEAGLTETTIAGARVPVSPWKRDNLAQWLQRNLPGVWIWMDILCVPQHGDENEIAACLQSIPHIFHGAECVHVLLEDHATLQLPTYDEFDEMYADHDEEYRATDPQLRQLPIMNLVTQWADVNGASLPDLAWIQRLWTRQEAQYSNKICFHGVAAPTEADDRAEPRPIIDINPLGLIGQLSSSMVMVGFHVASRILIELVAARGTPIAGLGGRERQQQGDLVVAFRELRAARRKTKKSQDFVLALFPTFDWYTVPERARTHSTFNLMADAIHQYERARSRAVLRSTMTGIFTPRRGPESQVELESIFQYPHDSFGFFSTFTTFSDYNREVDGSVRLAPHCLGKLVDWNTEVAQENWTETLSAVCIEQSIQSLERLYAMEALIKELHITRQGKTALRDFVLVRDPSPLAALPDRRAAVAWITCVHLVIGFQELERVLADGADLVLTKSAGDTRHYPTIISAAIDHEKAPTIYLAKHVDLFSADIAFLGYPENDAKCRLVGSLGSYTHRAWLAQPGQYHLATNATDFWVDIDG